MTDKRAAFGRRNCRKGGSNLWHQSNATPFCFAHKSIGRAPVAPARNLSKIYDLSEQEDWQVAQTSDGSKGSALRMDELRRREEQLEKATSDIPEEGIRKTVAAPFVLCLFNDLESHGVNQMSNVFYNTYKNKFVMS